MARRTRDGTQFYFRYTRPDGKRDTLRIGAYGEGEGRLTLKAGREEAQRLSGLCRQQPHLREWLEAEQHRQADALRRERNEREHATLAALLDGYADWLERQGKPSAKAVRAAIQRHVVQRWPGFAAMKANDLSKRELTQILSAVVEAGKGREAAKLRSYLRAAYAAALRAEGDATIPSVLHGFNLTANPAADLAAMPQFNVPRTHGYYPARIKAAMGTSGGFRGGYGGESAPMRAVRRPKTHAIVPAEGGRRGPARRLGDAVRHQGATQSTPNAQLAAERAGTGGAEAVAGPAPRRLRAVVHRRQSTDAGGIPEQRFPGDCQGDARSGRNIQTHSAGRYSAQRRNPFSGVWNFHGSSGAIAKPWFGWRTKSPLRPPQLPGRKTPRLACFGALGAGQRNHRAGYRTGERKAVVYACIASLCYRRYAALSWSVHHD